MDIKKIQLTNFYTLLGCFIFLFNYHTEKLIGAPLGEFVLLGVLLFQLVKTKKYVSSPNINLAFFSMLSLLVIAVVLQYVNSHSISECFRVFMRMSTFYAMIFMITITSNKRLLLQLFLGVFLGYFIQFILVFIAILGGGAPLYKIKYIMPVPLTLLVIIASYRRNLSKQMALILSVVLVFMVVLTVFGSARGLGLSVIVGGVFYMFVKIFYKSPKMLASVIVFVPFLPVIYILMTYTQNDPFHSLDLLYKFNLDTISNNERTLMLHEAVTTLINHPFTGVDLKEYLNQISFNTLFISNMLVGGESPHNYYLEVFVPFGLLGGFAMVVFLYNCHKHIIMTLPNNKEIIPRSAWGVVALLGVSWKMLSEPIASMQRVDIYILFALASALPYFISNSKSDTIS